MIISKDDFKSGVKVSVIALLLTLGATSAWAYGTWIDPTATANQNNASTPIVEEGDQTKKGGLILNATKSDTTYAATGLDVINGDAIVPNGNVGIGTASPSAKLEVAGQVKITGGAPGARRVLTSDVNGLGKWSGTYMRAVRRSSGTTGFNLAGGAGTAGSGEVGIWVICDSGDTLLNAWIDDPAGTAQYLSSQVYETPLYCGTTLSASCAAYANLPGGGGVVDTPDSPGVFNGMQFRISGGSTHDLVVYGLCSNTQ